MTHDQKIAKIQDLMRDGLNILIVPMSDPHLCEYVPTRFKNIEFLSGFSGSAGTLVIGRDFADLWTDSRYFLQAENELSGTKISLQKSLPGRGFMDFLQDLAKKIKNLRVGVDFSCISLAQKNQLEAAISPHGALLDVDFIDEIYRASGENRPLLPDGKIFAHDEKFAIVSAHEKLQKIAQILREKNADFHIIKSLEDIAYACNLRGSDIIFNPLFLAFLIVKSDASATLFLQKNAAQNLEPQILKNLSDAKISLDFYENFPRALENLPKSSRILLDPARTNAKIAAQIHAEKILAQNPTVLMKAQKNTAQARHVRDCMAADGVALVRFNIWLESALLDPKNPTNELEIAEKLASFRAQNPLYVSESFGAIVGYNANGAQPHYRATPENFAKISGSGLLLIDSGGQYQNGTTDITRVFPVGEISDAMRRDYTLVLKAHISLACAIFPTDLPSPLLDTLARAPLWAEHEDFGHGTGHGVGFFLNVHEGPQVISFYAPAAPHTRMKAGMITSNEPGIYRDGLWGVRLENLVINAPSVKNLTPDPERPCFAANDEIFDSDFLALKTLTFFPFERACIDKNMLTEREISWLNAYHEEVFAAISPMLSDPERDFLARKTAKI